LHSKLGKDDNLARTLRLALMSHVSMCMCHVSCACGMCQCACVKGLPSASSVVCVCVCVCVPLCVCGQISNGETQLKIEKEVCKEGDGAEASDKAMIVLPQGGVVVTGLTKPKTLNPEP
jgi:hypothetical protein